MRLGEWLLHCCLVLISLGFLGMGVQVLIAAYHQKDPFNFLMFFFSANFIILISGALTFGFIWRMVTAVRRKAP